MYKRVELAKALQIRNCLSPDVRVHIVVRRLFPSGHDCVYSLDSKAQDRQFARSRQTGAPVLLQGLKRPKYSISLRSSHKGSARGRVSGCKFFHIDANRDSGDNHSRLVS
jgi:hypothetical protein